jgi:hypothetical protein
MFELHSLAVLAGMVAAVLGGALVFWQPGRGINLRAVLADMRRCLTLGDDAIEPGRNCDGGAEVATSSGAHLCAQSLS